jgi:hypothetical protein
LLVNTVLNLPDAVIGSLKTILADKMAMNSAQQRPSADMVAGAYSMLCAVLKADNAAVLPSEFGYLNNVSRPYYSRF